MTREDPEIEAAFAESTRDLALRRIRIGCTIAIILLPLGSFIDLQLYRGHAAEFLKYRIAGSLAMAPLLALVHTAVGRRHHAAIGVALALIPAACMAFVISHTPEPARSPYYAGLNLVILAIGLVLQWTQIQSLVAVAGVILLYVLAAVRHAGDFLGGDFINNLYFIALTGVIVVIGNTVASRLRFNDFVSTQKLDHSRRQLEESNRKLRELDEIKGRFFANISHELRTPLTLLLAPLEAIRAQPQLQADPRVRELLETMQANGMRLLKLINDLLDLVRLDAGHLRLDLTAVDATAFLRGVLHSMAKVSEDKGIKTALSVAPEVTGIRGDPDKLEKIFFNLLFNAVKFTPAGGKIQVAARREGAFVAIDVTDNGVGISPEQLPHIFDRFWQADTSAQRKYQGAGIGLALVKELAGAHGGRVEVNSHQGKGTTMTVYLPPSDAPVTPAGSVPVHAPPYASPAQPAPDGNASDPWLNSLYRRAELFAGIPALREAVRPLTTAGHNRKPRLLVADDEPDMLRFLKLQLREDYDVIEAIDGNQAITLATQFLPDVILCDMMMPEKDGLQVCRELRQQRSTRPIPFLMLTARADDESKMQGLEAGASDFLSKPFSTAELRVRLKNLVDAFRLQKSLAWQNQKLEATLEQLKETEIQLVQSEKLASLGRLSAGIIHEINNPLNFAMTGLHMLSRQGGQLPDKSRAEFDETIGDIRDGIGRVAEIVGDLRSFTHPSAPDDMVDLRDALNSALRFLAAELKEGIRVEIEMPERFRVQGNRNKLIQVFINLLQNASDALKTKRFPEGESPLIRVTGSDEGPQRVLRFRDNGTGIPEMVLAQVFDPFFTTKDVGQGTGLGLSICHRIVTDAGGRIFATSEPGRFSQFTLEFPLPPNET
ncbi:MAG: response regulator [Verrucomicrobia bacterium]|nr:MAG: response regulator [Verrucomicrobiota bacterium]